MKDFREQYRDGSCLRVVDFVSHLALSVMLPGPFWFQWLPDLMLPFIFVKSWSSRRLLENDSSALSLHRFLHKIYVPLLFLTLGALTMQLWLLYLGAHWLAHVLLDQLTHENDWDKKGLF